VVVKTVFEKKLEKTSSLFSKNPVLSDEKT
jgi:hypothetical protein